MEPPATLTPGIDAAIEYLDSLQGSGIRPGLGRMRALLRALGSPQHRVPAIIVAGTNGKGSTSATLASILRCAGYRTALYTSPHLVTLNERWTIDGEPVSDVKLAVAIGEMRDGAARAGISPTYFEALTILAFLLFSNEQCDVVVLEVGMGGRLDATNVVRPLASVITPIGFDHMEFLGTTIRQIASEKSGVIHRGSIALTSNVDTAVLEVLSRRAARFDVPFHALGTEVVIDSVADSQQTFRLTTPHSAYTLETPLAGDFQRTNVALAVRTAEELAPRFTRIDANAIVRGVAETRWRGRLERFVIAGQEFWVDGAHNAHAVGPVSRFLAQTLGRPRLLLLGIMADKDVAEVVRTLAPLFDRVVTTEPYPPRSIDAAMLAEKVRACGIPATAEPDPRRALALALDAEERYVAIAGSLYLAGAAIAFLDARSRDSVPV